MKIFLDVGAHAGETAKAVLTSKHHFDKIYCFEPQKKIINELKQIESEKVIINNYGLFNTNCKKNVYYKDRTDGGSMYRDKFKKILNTEECDFVSASEWFAENIKDEDDVTLKINCEGAECDIMDDLFSSEEYKKITALIIDFDVRKIKSQKHREQEIREKIKTSNIPLVFMLGSEELNKMARGEAVRYYRKREKWVHYYLNNLFNK